LAKILYGLVVDHFRSENTGMRTDTGLKGYFHQMLKPDFSTKNLQKPHFWIMLFLIAAIALLLRFGFNIHSKKTKVVEKPVLVAVSRTADVPIYINALGTVTSRYTVTVKTQISGIMQEVYYKEGQLVKKGELLAQIDPRPYEAQLIEYEGQLARDKALLDNARIDLVRYKTLWSQNSISQQTYQTQEALVKQYEGTVQLDQGLIDATLVNLIYCKIISPINGRIGLRLIDPGNFVQPSDTTALAVVTTLSPIDVVFPIAEDNIPQIVTQMEKSNALSVAAYDRQQKTLLATGKLLTIDNQINTSTGTVNFKAQFDNGDNHLFANQFVNIRLLVDTLNKVTVVPTAAIQYRNNQPLIYAVDKENKVVITKIKLGVTQGEDTVVTGILPDQVVIIEGADNVIANDRVMITNKKDLSLAPKQEVKT
jgi:multidrug efflux system membrane fusion protein